MAITLYGVAMSLLVTTLTVTLALAQGGLLRLLRLSMSYVEIFSACVMILSGLYLSWYWFNDIRNNYDDAFTGRVLTWQENIAQSIDENRFVLAVIFGLIVACAITYTIISRQREISTSK